jgi:hypothetical protein
MIAFEGWRLTIGGVFVIMYCYKNSLAKLQRGFMEGWINSSFYNVINHHG